MAIQKKKNDEITIAKVLDEKLSTVFEKVNSMSDKVIYSHKGFIASILIDILDTVWKEPFKNPDDVDRILKHWHKQSTTFKELLQGNKENDRRENK